MINSSFKYDWGTHSLNHDLGDGTMSAVGDLDGDGDMDLALSDHDRSRLIWMENTNGKGDFTSHHLFDGLETCHSVIIADFNNDGLLDIYAGDTGNKGGKAYIWENDGEGSFIQNIVLENVVGHDTRAADVDGDGDLDMCSKPWRGSDKTNWQDGATFEGLHLYYRNMFVENGGEPATRIQLLDRKSRKAKLMVILPERGIDEGQLLWDVAGRGYINQKNSLRLRLLSVEYFLA